MKVGQEAQSPPDDEWSYLSLAIEPRGLVLRKWQDDVVVVVAEYPVTSTRDTWYDVQIDFSGTGNEHVTVKHGLHGGTMATAIDASTGLASDHVNVGFAVGKLAKDGYLFDNLRIRGNSISAESMEQEFIYDVFGRRVAKTTYPNYVAKTTYFAYDGDRVIEELNGDHKVIASYVYGNYIDEVLEMWRDADGDEEVDANERYYYLQDDMYNVLALTDHTGTIVERYEYGDYGAPTVYDAGNIETGNQSAYGNPYLFNGRHWDADTGLYWYRTRYMDPELGRFISRDSIGLWGDENNLGNPYTYAGNNPWTHLDPYGEASLDEILPVYGYLYGETGMKMLNAFQQEGGQISMEGVLGQVDFQTSFYYGPRFEIELEDSIDALQAAQYLWQGISEASSDFRIARHLLDTDDIGGYRSQMLQGLNVMRANAEQGGQYYLGVLSALNEGADWAIITQDLSEGRYTSLLAALPFVWAGLTKARSLPHGFDSPEAFEEFSGILNTGVQRSGYEDVQAIFQGSAVTGRSYRTGELFDAGRISDFDIALSSPVLLEKAKSLGIPLRSSGTRTGPLLPEHIKLLGLDGLSQELAQKSGRPVNFMVFGSPESAFQRSPSMLVPR